MSLPTFAFVVHPLVGWHRRVMGVRRGHPELALGHSGGIEAVGLSGHVDLPTSRGSVRGLIVAVPDTAPRLASDQRRALQHQIRAAAIAAEHGASAIGLANALGVVAGRGSALAEATALPVTPGHAATAWAAIEITKKVLLDTPGPVGVLGFKGTVGDAVAAALSELGHDVWVDADGKAAQRRAAKLGCAAGSRAELAARSRVLVGGSTTGPVLHPSLIKGETTLVDLALPPTLCEGHKLPGLRVVAGETLRMPGSYRADFWGRVWLLMAQYGRGCIYACLAEPMLLALDSSRSFSGARKLDLATVRELGRELRALGYEPVIRNR